MNLEYPNCIVCGGDIFSDYLTVEDNQGEIFSLKQCKCSLVLTSPRPCSSAICEYYSEEYKPHSNAHSDSSLLIKIFRKISYSWKARLVKRVANENVNMLDMGGGDGALAFYIKNKISNVHVYEKDIDCIHHINSIIMEEGIGNMFSTADYESLKDGYYNIVTLFHSLEHIHDIDKLFLNINRITKKNAKMIIAVPNITAAEIDFLTNKWAAWDVPRHLYHFNFKTLSKLLNKNGWEVVGSRSMFQDTFFNIYMSLKGNYVKKIFSCFFLLVYSLINQILFSNKQSSNLVICQKKQ